MKTKLVVGLVVFAGLWFSASTVLGWRSDAIVFGLRVDSIQAANDTTRLVLSDSLRVFERRAVQTAIERDALDEELSIVTRANMGLQVQVRGLEREETVAEVVVEPDTDTRTAVFEWVEEPFEVRVEASLPPPPLAASARLSINLAPIPLAVRLSCGDSPPDSNIIPALVQVTAPEWATLTLTDIIQEPGICNPTTFTIPSPPSLIGRVVKPVLFGTAVFGVLKLLEVL